MLKVMVDLVTTGKLEFAKFHLTLKPCNVEC